MIWVACYAKIANSLTDSAAAYKYFSTSHADLRLVFVRVGIASLWPVSKTNHSAHCGHSHATSIVEGKLLQLTEHNALPVFSGHDYRRIPALKHSCAPGPTLVYASDCKCSVLFRFISLNHFNVPKDRWCCLTRAGWHFRRKFLWAHSPVALGRARPHSLVRLAVGGAHRPVKWIVGGKERNISISVIYMF